MRAGGAGSDVFAGPQSAQKQHTRKRSFQLAQSTLSFSFVRLVEDTSRHYLIRSRERQVLGMFSCHSAWLGCLSHGIITSPAKIISTAGHVPSGERMVC